MTNYVTDENFIDMCRALNFSACVDKEKNLELLKIKLAGIGRIDNEQNKVYATGDFTNPKT